MPECVMLIASAKRMQFHSAGPKYDFLPHSTAPHPMSIKAVPKNKY